MLRNMMHIPTLALFNLACLNTNKSTSCQYLPSKGSKATTTTGLLAAAVVIASASASAAAPQEAETLSNIPQQLSGECASPKDCTKPRIQRPKSRKAESCTIKCVGTCIRGGEGSPGEGPLNVRSLVECSDICNLLGDRDDGP